MQGVAPSDEDVTTERTFVIDGLSEPVEILVDRWGVPHIYARDRRDVFIAQGFNAARERLFQLDLWRRRGLGLLAQVLGPEYIEHDRAARIFLYRGDAHSEWLAYGSGTKRVVTAFVDGINAYLGLCEADPDLLPPEFAELGYRPGYWSAEDVTRIRAHGLYQNLEQEVARARTLARFGADVEGLRCQRTPQFPIVVPDGLDLSAISDEVLRVYRLATCAVSLDTPPPAGAGGSNNWVVGGARTASGRPLLANDPHRAVTLPSLRYIAHLVAPGLDVIGAGEPALPGISVGHNQTVAFGFTIFPIDQEDLYVYETHPDDPSRYRYRDGWERMQTIREEIPVLGGGPVQVDLRFTRHGPVICEQQPSGTAFAVRAAWLEPGMAPYLASLDYLTAATSEDFADALNRWGAPGENHVYADVDGNIGWRPAGLVPIRPNWDGTLPVPGDGRYEWAGFYDMDQLPAAHNPEQGWFATANEMNLPEDYPAVARPISFEFAPPFRRDRIGEVLAANDRLTVADCAQLQADRVSLVARRVLALAGSLPVTEPAAQAALEMFTSWNGILAPESAAAALFEIWYRRHLRPALLTEKLRAVLGVENVTEALSMALPAEGGGDPRIDLALLEELRANAPQALAELVGRSLSSALTEAHALLGDDTASWRWGSLNRAMLRVPLAAHSSQPWATIGPAPRGGSEDTVNAAAYGPDFVQTMGATFRIVMDVGCWDNCVAMNSPGQSGDRRSRHYADLFSDWSQDRSFPLVYNRAAVDKQVLSRYVLQPAPPSQGTHSACSASRQAALRQ